MYKAHHGRSTFGSWDVQKVHAVVAWIHLFHFKMVQPNYPWHMMKHIRHVEWTMVLSSFLKYTYPLFDINISHPHTWVHYRLVHLVNGSCPFSHLYIGLYWISWVLVRCYISHRPKLIFTKRTSLVISPYPYWNIFYSNILWLYHIRYIPIALQTTLWSSRLKPLDDLFNLRCPAAMVRGQGEAWAIDLLPPNLVVFFTMEKDY